VWEWAVANVDFSLEPRYETPLHGAYNANFLPMWKEIQENFTDIRIREQWILKNSRAGCSENCLLNPLRYAVAVSPKSMQYITGDELSARRFMDKRIKLGMNCSPMTRRKLRKAHADTKYDIAFEDMDLVVSWPKNKMAFKQTGYEWILCDEFSTWPNFSADMMRKRTDTYRYSHICGISSPDPQQNKGSDEDPIFLEFKKTDQRYWFMKDPKTGNWFRFEKGDKDTEYGLKWPASCRNENDEWDLEAVEREAYYITPDGTRIDEKDRWELVEGGRWQPTNTDAPEDKRGYHMNSFYMPFKSGAFGHIARAFLEAKKGGAKTLKVFIYEYLATEWTEGTLETGDDELKAREARYLKGTGFTEFEKFVDVYKTKPKLRYMTIDVQKHHMWWVIREWVDGGDSGLVNFGSAPTWADIDGIADEYAVHKVYIDNHYAARSMEVYEYCFEFTAIPTMGMDSKYLPFTKKEVDPFEGKRGGGTAKIMEYHFNTDTFKTNLMQLMRGETMQKWYVYRHPERDYVRQVTAEHKQEGEWKLREGHPHNHLFDCEVLQLLAATIDGVYRFDFDNA
jgi:phage terminase large subunit GpA-like protein